MTKQDKQYFVMHEKHTAYSVSHLDTGVCWASHNCPVTEWSAVVVLQWQSRTRSRMEIPSLFAVSRHMAVEVVFLSIGSAAAGGEFSPKICVMFRCKKPRGEAISMVRILWL